MIHHSVQKTPTEKMARPAMNRREFLKISAAAAGGLMTAQTIGCAGSHPVTPTAPINYLQPRLLTHCHVVDVNRGILLKNQSILIRQGRIALIQEEIPITRDMETIDMGGRYLIPGLIDGHCHTTLPSVGGFDIQSALATLLQIERNYTQQIESGVTTVRDTAAFVKVLMTYVNNIETGKIPGPRIVHCGCFFNIDGSHPGDIKASDVSVFAPIALKISGEMFINFKNTESLKERLKENLRTGPSFIKLSLDDESVLCGKPGKNPIYEEAHKREILKFSETYDLPVVAHVHYKSGFARAQEFPLFNMEHMVIDQPLSDKEIWRMADNKMSIVPTMILGQLYAPPEAFDRMPKAFQTDFVRNEQEIWRDYFNSDQEQYALPAITAAQKRFKEKASRFLCEELYRKKIFFPKPDLYYGYLTHGVATLLKMKAAGILIGCGTDAGVPFSNHGTLWREMELYGRIGFTNAEILKCATLNNAKILRMADQIGTIERGKFADITVLDTNPLEQISAVRTPSLVIKEGRVLFSKKAMRQEQNRFIV
jgi:imidazolonepropionase-like amidohydrolase